MGTISEIVSFKNAQSVARNVTTETGSTPIPRANIPTKSAQFSGLNSLSQSHANFGAYNRKLFAVVGYVKLNATTGNQCIIGKGDAATFPGSEFNFTTNASGALSLGVFGGTSDTGRITTATGAFTAGQWFHFMFAYDSDNASDTNRMRLWLNGTEVTSFTTDTPPPQGLELSTATSAPMYIGDLTGGSYRITGNVYQIGMYSGLIPAISTVYSSTANIGLPLEGLYFAHNPSVSVTNDDKLANAWTNNGTVTASTTIPH